VKTRLFLHFPDGNIRLFLTVLHIPEENIHHLSAHSGQKGRHQAAGPEGIVQQ